MPLTTVDPYGWNAEMLAARKLRRNHVEVLRHEVVGTWYRDYKEACKKWLSTSDSRPSNMVCLGSISSGDVWGCNSDC